MRYRELLRLTSLIMAFVTLLSFSMFAPSALAADGAVSVEGKLYTFDEKEHYEITGTRYSGATNGKNTYGSFTISGNVLSDGDEGGVPSYSVSGGNVALLYTYTDTLRDAPETKWHLIEDNSKAVADFKLDSNIKKGAIIPEYFDYHISFSFSVRNGNCMVYPFDVKTGQELTDESITANGFKLDMAKSRYLTIDVKYARVVPGANGYVEDVRFNRPAKDGDSYTDEGIYTFNVKNLYTGESTTKKIYVGDVDYIRALSLNNLSVAELNDRVAAGATIESNGALVLPTSSPAPEGSQTPAPAATVAPPATSIAEESTGVQTPANDSSSRTSTIVPIAVVAAIAITGAAFFAVAKKKKKNNDN